MRKIIVTEFLTLDGVMEEPQNWSFPYFIPEMEKYKQDELFASDVQLLGRVTYEVFATSWLRGLANSPTRLILFPKSLFQKP